MFFFRQIFNWAIKVGDVIYIEANNGAVKRVGRSDTFATGKLTVQVLIASYCRRKEDTT